MPHYRPSFHGLTDGIAVGDTIIIMTTSITIIAIGITMEMMRGAIVIRTEKSQLTQLQFINL